MSRDEIAELNEETKDYFDESLTILESIEDVLISMEDILLRMLDIMEKNNGKSTLNPRQKKNIRRVR